LQTRVINKKRSYFLIHLFVEHLRIETLVVGSCPSIRGPEKKTKKNKNKNKQTNNQTENRQRKKAFDHKGNS